MVLALVPPWWHRVMDPLVVHYAQGKRSRVNLDPRGERRLQKLLDAYAAG